MNCEYWEDVVRQLRDPSRSTWAAHVLSTELPKPSDPRMSNLARALGCVPAGEIIEGAIYAYRDWSAQPYCDLILACFEPAAVLSVFRGVERPDANMKVGMLGYLEDVNRGLAAELASSLDTSDEDERVREAVR